MPLYLTSGNMHVRDEDGTYHDMHILTGGDKEEIITEVAAGAVAAISEDLNELKTNVVNAASTAMEQKAQEAIGDIPSDYTELSEEVDDLKSAINQKAPAIYDTSSGAIASFDDGADGMPIKALTVNVEPVQDLHGYENPWPAGGGKNLCAPLPAASGSGIAYTPNTDDAGNVVSYHIEGLTTNSYALNIATANLTAGVQYKLTGAITTPDLKLRVYGTSSFGEIVGTDSGDGRTFTVSTTKTYYIAIGFESGTDINNNILPMIRLVSDTDATFAPYSNICPISGWTGANVSRTGKNLFNPSNVQAYYVSDDPTIVRYGYLYPPGTYTIVNKESFPFYAKTVKNDWSVKSASTVINGNSNATITINEGYILCVFNNFIDYTGIQLAVNKGNDTEYTAFTGTTLPITFPSEAGIVYGGTLDVTSGVLTVDRALIDIDSNSLNWSYDKTTNSMLAAFPNLKPTPDNDTKIDAISTISKCVPASDRATATGTRHYAFLNSNDIYVRDSGYTSVSEFRTAFSGQYFVYKLTTPTVYQLTPTEVITTLLGQNNIWADCGPVDVDYPADTKLYINNKIAAAIAAALNA